jgi:hypothetical protein
MYYHSRELRHVVYGKIGPAPDEAIDVDFAVAYRWLGRHCGYAPQVWLSRSRSALTGFRFEASQQTGRFESILFGFESIQGFPVDHDVWNDLLTPLCNAADEDAGERAIVESLEQSASDPDPEICDDPAVVTWRETRDLGAVLSKHLFVENDQVVVPSLNLKAAKKVVCTNERQKKALRRMGFIEDRIVIRGPGG